MRRIVFVAALLLGSCSALLSAAWSPPDADPMRAPAGIYAVEAAHTQVLFSVMHLGLTEYSGVFSDCEGTLRFDPADPASMTVEVSVPVASLHTTNAVLDEKLRGPGWLDAAHFPAMRFRSVQVVPTGGNTADVRGELTLHGETHPLLLRATFNGAAVSPFSGREQLGFSLAGTLRRSVWGVDNLVPAISNDLQITIAASFEKRG